MPPAAPGREWAVGLDNNHLRLKCSGHLPKYRRRPRDATIPEIPTMTPELDHPHNASAGPSREGAGASREEVRPAHSALIRDPTTIPIVTPPVDSPKDEIELPLESGQLILERGIMSGSETHLANRDHTGSANAASSSRFKPSSRVDAS